MSPRAARVGRADGAHLRARLVLVFLVLAAQYESFVLPFIVLLVGAARPARARCCAQLGPRHSNDVFCQVGLVMLIGLSGKNAILIVEFAQQLRERGQPVVEAALEAAASACGPS